MTNILNVVAAAYGSVADIEIVWTAIAAFGLFFSFYNIRESRKDLVAVEILTGSRGNRAHILALAGLKMEIARAVIQAIFITVGIMAMTLPGTPTRLLPLKLVIFQAIFTYGFIISALLLTLKSYWNYRLRVDLRNSLEEEKSLLKQGSQSAEIPTVI